MELPSALLSPSLKNNKIQPEIKFVTFREMELSSSNIKKILMFSYILGNGTFKPKLEKIKNPPRKKFLIFREMELSSSNTREFFMFSPKKVLYFGKQKPRKNSLYFLKRKLFLHFRKRKPGKTSLRFMKRNSFIFQETESPKKLFIFQEVTFRARKIKRTHS